MTNPIYYDDAFISALGPEDRIYMANAGYRTEGWYFWDEVDAYCYGPFKDQFEAEAELNNYRKWLYGGVIND